MYNRRFPFHHTPASGKRLDFIRIMIAIIAEKPSVGQDIARVVGATEKKDGYIVGNGYMVTWALGHLVSLALPDAYGYTRTAAEDLPMIPDPFRLVVRQVRTDRGMVTDIAAGRQLKVISEESTTERIKLLEEGAEDYILKPFNPLELKIRIKKIID